MPEVDAGLVTALKMAKGKKMFFAFVPKGADGKLIVSKAKIPDKQIAEAKKEIGGGSPIKGKCTGPLTALVFQVAKAAPATMEPALKKVVKRDTGLSIVPEVQLASDAEAEEEEEAEHEAPVTATPAATPAAAPAAAAASAAKAPPATKAAPDYGPWQAARNEAIKDLKALAAKVAGTKHASAAGVLKEINSIITKLPATPAANEINKLEDFIRHDDTITAAEEVPDHFHDLDIREPLIKALEGLKK